MISRKYYSTGMATSVKLSERDKKELDRLQAKLTMQTGEKRTQQEILAALIAKALDDETVLDAIAPVWRPLTDPEFQKVLSMTSDWGVATRWQDMDRQLYGP